MAEAPFAVAVTTHDAVNLTGIRVATTMAGATTDCPALWERFMALAPELRGPAPAEHLGESFGVSYATNPVAGQFEYVAAMPTPVGAPLPEGMERLTLPAGLYAFTVVPNLDHIGRAFTYIYTEWIAGRDDYALNMAAPCFERYDHRFLHSGEFEIFVPVVKK